MFQKFGLFLVKLLTFFILIIVGVWLGFMAFQLWLRVDATGVFVRWRLLDGPQNFRHLIYANSRDVIAQADNGKLYLYQSDLCIASTDTICDTWVEAQPGFEFDSLTKRIVESGCESAYEYYTKDTDYRYLAKPIYPRYPPLNGAKPKECVVELEFIPSGGEILTYYVLLDNGKVWKWIHKYIAMLHLVSAIRWALVGLIIGLIIWYRFQKALSQNKLQGAT